MRKLLFIVPILFFLISCKPGRIEKKEPCNPKGCNEVYLENTSETKAYKYVIQYEVKFNKVDYPSDYENGNMTPSMKLIFDKETQTKKGENYKGTQTFRLLPGENVFIGESLKTEDFYVDYYLPKYSKIFIYSIEYEIVGYLEIDEK